jgi:lipopolysaccharide export LptBFGC system permease protein LptF
MGKLMSSSTTSVAPQKMSNMSLDELLVARGEAQRKLDNAKPDSRDQAEARVTRTRATYYISRNFAFAYSTLALAMIAIPLGIRVGRQETYANMAVAVALGMTYFFLVSVIGMLERVPTAHPEILIWLPNVAFQILAVWLMIRANRH